MLQCELCIHIRKTFNLLIQCKGYQNINKKFNLGVYVVYKRVKIFTHHRANRVQTVLNYKTVLKKQQCIQQKVYSNFHFKGILQWTNRTNSIMRTKQITASALHLAMQCYKLHVHSLSFCIIFMLDLMNLIYFFCFFACKGCQTKISPSPAI